MPADDDPQVYLPAVVGLPGQGLAQTGHRSRQPAACLPAVGRSAGAGRHFTIAPVASLGRPVVREIPVPQRSGFPAHQSTTYVETSL
jgi:hypothetical protein